MQRCVTLRLDMSTFVHQNGGMNASSGAEEAPDTPLGRHMDDSRNDLGLTWDDVAKLSKLSRQTLYDIRKGVTDYGRMRSSTKRKIEKVFQWERGDFEAAAIHGVAPAPLEPAEEVAPPAEPPAIDPETGTPADLQRELAYFRKRLNDKPTDYPRLVTLLDLAARLYGESPDTQSSVQSGT